MQNSNPISQKIFEKRWENTEQDKYNKTKYAMEPRIYFLMKTNK